MLSFLVFPGGTQEAFSESSPTVTTSILKWHDGKKAVFIMAFDDSAPSAITNVIPELKKRGMKGTFYINPGNPPFNSLKKEWEAEAQDPNVEYANHTFTHVGATSVEQLEIELEKCNAEINRCYPALKQPRLISFGQPGGVPWTISRSETNALLAKLHLVERPPFIGYPFQIKTQEQMLAMVDMALSSGEMQQLVFHGVGGDWHVTPLDIFFSLLDKLEANRDQLWVTDPISWHKYLTERTGAEVKVLPSEKDFIRIQLVCKTDPAFYDFPLTLATRVPIGWKKCRIVQGSQQSTVPVVNGVVTYPALPNSDVLSIQDSSEK